jgi:DNA-damage-inducible protein D
MVTDLPESAIYKHTMAVLEKNKKSDEHTPEHWLGREIMIILGYERWENFEHVIRRAASALQQNSVDSSHHIAETTKMVGIGSGTTRRVRDFYLSRLACYLIAMNGDPTKPEIAAAQAYFAVQTRAAELAYEKSQDEKRIELREKVTRSFKTVSGVAKEAGVPNTKQPIFHDARYQGLYGMPRREMMTAKGLDRSENPFDRMGALELSANDFQMNLAAETIDKENIRGENNVIRKNREVAQKVRHTMIDSGSNPPEHLPVAEPIREVAKRLKAQKKLTDNPNA